VSNWAQDKIKKDKTSRGGQIRTADPLTPRPNQADESAQEREIIEHEPPEEFANTPQLAQFGPTSEASGGTGDAVENALADGLRQAAAAGAWSTVERLAGELEARRKQRAQANGDADVVTLDSVRKR